MQGAQHACQMYAAHFVSPQVVLHHTSTHVIIVYYSNSLRMHFIVREVPRPHHRNNSTKSTQNQAKDKFSLSHARYAVE